MNSSHFTAGFESVSVFCTITSTLGANNGELDCGIVDDKRECNFEVSFVDYQNLLNKNILYKVISNNIL